MKHRRLAFAIVSVAALAAAPVAVAATASAAQPAATGAHHGVVKPAALTGFQIRSDQSGLCMSVAEDNPLPGAEIDMEPCYPGRAGQVWNFGPNNWVLPSVGTGLCLDDRWNNPGGGGASTYPCQPGWTQEQWTFDGSSWVNANQNCLDATDANPNPGTVVKLFGCVGVSNQHWHLVGVG
jgi:hypothetical protein